MRVILRTQVGVWVCFCINLPINTVLSLPELQNHWLIGQISAAFFCSMPCISENEELKCCWYFVVFRCRQTSTWTPRRQLCREWSSLCTKMPRQHWNSIETKDSTMCSWWVPKSGKPSSVTFTERVPRIGTSHIGFLLFIVRMEKEMERFALSVCRQWDSRVAPKRFVLSLNVNWLMSHDEISAKYKG